MKICSFLLTLFMCYSAFAAEVNLSIDKKTITDGDTFKLTVDYNGDDNQEPDFSAIQQDFKIVSRSTSSYITYNNGQLSQTKQWTLILRPQKTGKISIKPIHVGNLSSNYAEIEVKELTDVAFVPDSKENINSPYFQIEQSVFPTSPYVQQQVTLLVTIYDSIGLQNGSININENTQKDWSVVSLSKESITKREIINGKQMNVTTFAFAAFPQRSGELLLPRVSFEGFYLKNNDIDLAEFDDFFSLGFSFSNILSQKVPVRMQTKAEKINIQPIPSTYTGKQWLPLTKLIAKDSFSEQPSAKVGDAISRKITLFAVGLQKNMLPQITFAETPAFKQYPESPEIIENVVDGNIVTTATINTVYIPTTAGKHILPPLEIEWFNVKTKQMEKTVIAPKTVLVEGSSVASTNTSNLGVVEPITKVDNSKETLVVDKKEQNSWKKFFKIKYLYFVFLLIPILFWLLKKPKNPYRDKVIHYIKTHDYKAARSALIDWAKIKFSRQDIRNLNMIADIVQNDDFSKQLLDLNSLLYSSKEENFNSAKFLETFKKIDKIKSKVQKNIDVLPNLYN